jgi:hypothetical protein
MAVVRHFEVMLEQTLNYFCAIYIVVKFDRGQRLVIGRWEGEPMSMWFIL